MGVLLCCCPPPSSDDGNESAAPLPKVRVGRRGAMVQVKESESGILVVGAGTAMADTSIEQDAAYWEVVVQEPGKDFHVGVAYAQNFGLLDAQIGDGKSSWAVGPEGLSEVKAGDILGVAFGQGDIPNLRFYHNGEALESATVSRVRGESYPAVSVGEGAKLLFRFDPASFTHEPPRRHTEVRPPRKML